MSPKQNHIVQAQKIFRFHGGILRTTEAIRLGIHPKTLYSMRDMNILEQLGRGLYRLTDFPPLSNQDLVTVAKRVPRGVVCLISALAFHEMTTQIPHQVDLAMERGAEPPRLKHPPIKIYWFKGKAYSEGIKIYEIDTISVKVYEPEKTVADCFKFRNKIGLDIALEALKAWRDRKNSNIDKLMYYARICRIEKVIQPYLEAIL